MNLWTNKEINRALLLDDNKDKEIVFSGISIDTRTIKKGDLYIPVKGKKFDGHNYIGEAFEKGALGSLIEFNKKKLAKDNGKLIFVKDTIKALNSLARFSRNRIKNLITICITGSSGKTTLKEWAFKTLKEFKKSYRTFQNYNNEIGMPLTLANMPRNTEVCILELGMNSPGEIRRLSKIAHPDIAIITNTGSAHSANFKDVKDIAEEKSEIFSFFKTNSIAMIPSESDYYDLMYKKASKRTEKIYSFGYDKKSNLRIFKKNSIWKFSVLDEEIEFKKDISFINWDINVLLILGLMKILNLNLKKVVPILKRLHPIPGRGKTTQIVFKNKSFTLIDESYNSNPESLKHAIESLKNHKNLNSRKILVIGDMLELGKMSEIYHKNIVETLLKISPEIIITVGNYSKVIFENLPKRFLKFHFDNYENVFNKLLKIIKNKDVIMIKGSNSINLHLISQELIRLG